MNFKFQQENVVGLSPTSKHDVIISKLNSAMILKLVLYFETQSTHESPMTELETTEVYMYV